MKKQFEDYDDAEYDELKSIRLFTDDDDEEMDVGGGWGGRRRSKR